ncbi:MAG: hypothetical protein NVSMB66_6260 [Candidatus Doudnabacteria bacterium]
MSLAAIAPASAWTGVDVTTAVVPVGTRMRDDQNNNEYIYCTGVAGLVANDFVQISSAYAVTRSAAAAKGLCGVAQAAFNASTKFGWVQVYGTATVNIGANTTSQLPLYLHATTGTVSTTVAANDIVVGSLCTQTSAGSTATCQLSYPVCTNKLG